VERAIARLGRDLRTARLRRNLTIDDVANRIGTGPRAVRGAERGKPSTGIMVHAALLWTHDPLHPFGALADPLSDGEGLALDRPSGRARRQGAGQ